jgi:hypothetical protein
MFVMRRMRALVTAIIVMIAIGGVARAQNYVIDQGTSDAITKYLHMNELPMVTAQFSTSPGGSKQLILTGFVATQFGRNDAERIANAYLNDPSVNIVDQILLDPHVEDLRPPPGAAASASGAQIAQQSRSTVEQDDAGDLQKRRAVAVGHRADAAVGNRGAREIGSRSTWPTR